MPINALLLKEEGAALSRRIKDLTPQILAWYDGAARVLPWRQNPRPYPVWLSEIMLQQTRVEAVIPYFHRFLAALPEIADLAACPEEKLLKLWEGLGYYNRVRNLQKAARTVMAEYGGRLPDTEAELKKLPGIGDYTAAAIASIAYGRPAAAVDGNVLRVVTRILASRGDILSPAVKKAVTALVREMIPPERPGDFTQAMMEIGATVCLPNGAPLCGQCPLREECLANRHGLTGEIPVKAEKKARRVEQRTLFAVLSQGRLLLHRRPAKGLLAGLWELPGLAGRLDQAAALARLEKLGFEVERITPLPAAQHIFTHIQWEMTGYLAEAASPLPLEGCVWVLPEELEHSYALPSAFLPYARLLPRHSAPPEKI